MAIVTYELIAANSVNTIQNPKNGTFRKFPPSFAIPAESIALIDGEIVEIRYLKGQRNIVKEQQMVSSDRAVKLTKPQFNNGFLAVDDRVQKNLIDYLDHHPLNELNTHMHRDGTRPAFRKRDIVEVTRKKNEATNKKINVLRAVFETDYELKIKPIARYLGFDVKQSSSLVLNDMLNWADANPDRFIELLDSAIVERFDTIQKAADLGIIKLDANSISWGDGRQIVSVPQNFNSAEYLAKISYDTAYHAMWSELTRQLENIGKKKPAEAVVENPPKASEEFENTPTEKLFSLAKEAGIVKWHPPHFIVGASKAKGKDEFIKLIDSDKDLRNLIITYLKAE